MNTRTRKRLLMAAAVVIMLNFNSCGKYDDGPAFSLKTKTGRLVGEWEIIEIDREKVDGEMIFEFEDDNDFVTTQTFTYNGDSYTYTSKGEWAWGTAKESFEIEIDKEVMEFDINRLTNSELWFEDEDRMEYEAEKL